VKYIKSVILALLCIILIPIMVLMFGLLVVSGLIEIIIKEYFDEEV